MPSLLAGQILRASAVNQVLGAPAKYGGTSTSVASTGTTGTATNTNIVYMLGPTTYASVAGGIITMLVSGRYRIEASGAFATDSTGTVRAWRVTASVAGLILRSTPYFISTTGIGAAGSDVNVVDLVAGETLTFDFRHNATTNLTITCYIILTPVPTS